jgi:hypothetical protein
LPVISILYIVADNFPILSFLSALRFWNRCCKIRRAALVFHPEKPRNTSSQRSGATHVTIYVKQMNVDEIMEQIRGLVKIMELSPCWIQRKPSG